MYTKTIMMDQEKALNAVARQCSRKEMCSNDIRKKLERWEVPAEAIEKIILFLQNHQFIDDTRYAKIYAEDKFHFNHWGKQKIFQMLKQKGIASDIIEEALKHITSEAYNESCVEILKQKYRAITETDPYKVRGKLTRFAICRGFDYDTVKRSLDQLFAQY